MFEYIFSSSRRVNSMNSYAGKIIVSEGTITDTRYTIRNSYAGKFIVRVFTTDYYSIFYR